jgi:hypothetical protein
MKNTKKKKEKKKKELKLNRKHPRYETYIHIKKANRSNIKCLILCIKNTRIQKQFNKSCQKKGFWAHIYVTRL